MKRKDPELETLMQELVVWSCGYMEGNTTDTEMEEQKQRLRDYWLQGKARAKAMLDAAYAIPEPYTPDTDFSRGYREALIQFLNREDEPKEDEK